MASRTPAHCQSGDRRDHSVPEGRPEGRRLYDPSLRIGSFVLVGPSTTWLIRHLNSRLDRDGDGVVIEAALTPRALGLGERSGRHAPLLRSIRRALDYDLIGLEGHEESPAVSEVTLLVRRLFPPLSERLADRLPPGLALEHRRYDSAVHADEPPLLRHARQLARTHQQLEARSTEEAS